ncbi:MAG: tyrosine-type recombinase/integrase [Romboutsia sp.]
MKDSKTINSIRTITTPRFVLSKIKNAKVIQNKLKLEGVLDNEHNVVILNNSLRPFTPNYMSRQFKRFLSTNNIPHIRFHDLSYTSATLILKSGVNIKVASQRLGHKTINTTLDIYSHVLKDMDQEASDIIDDLIYKKS